MKTRVTTLMIPGLNQAKGVANQNGGVPRRGEVYLQLALVLDNAQYKRQYTGSYHRRQYRGGVPTGHRRALPWLRARQKLIKTSQVVTSLKKRALSVGGTIPSHLLDIKGLFTQGSPPSRIFGDPVRATFASEGFDGHGSNRFRYHFWCEPDSTLS